ncbi:Spinocerebellar ataxia type 10 protein domain containing protein [Novymonas esmeraldas]|uniref:Spinocerebellar ataxia type 10 protein domain containing protein n=1 Tax=Novymonas esmeraldas TaxID=1808958 RepID=A0AAW0EKJ2_9TRYP
MAASPKGRLADVNQEELAKIGPKIDDILSLCLASLDNLRDMAFKFQYEQAAEKAAYRGAETRPDPMTQLTHVLRRMVDLTLGTARAVYDQTLLEWRRRKCEAETDSSSSPSGSSQSMTSPEVLRNSSVEDFAEGSNAWLERGSHLSLLSLEVLSSVLLAHHFLRQGLQRYMLDENVLDYLEKVFDMERDHELCYFPEAFKTECMRLIANLTHENVEVNAALAERETFLFNILSATKIDEENPGMVEWAEFAIRNICESSPAARDKIQRLVPQSITEESRAVLGDRCNYTFTSSGKVQLHTNKSRMN